MYTKRLLRIALIVVVILLIPLFGTLFVAGWQWGPSDFLSMGALLFGTGLLIDLAMQKITDSRKKLIVIVAIVGVLLLVWVELAVGAVSRTLGF